MALKEARHRFVRFDGAMVRSDRTRSIDVFRSDPDVPVILMSLKAGGVGYVLLIGKRFHLRCLKLIPQGSRLNLTVFRTSVPGNGSISLEFSGSDDLGILPLNRKPLIAFIGLDVRFLVYGEQEVDGSGRPSPRFPSTNPDFARPVSAAAKQQLSQLIPVVARSAATPAHAGQPAHSCDPALPVVESAAPNVSVETIRLEPQPEVNVLDAEPSKDSSRLSASPLSSLTQSLDATRTATAFDCTQEFLLSPSRPRPEAFSLSVDQAPETTQMSKDIHGTSGLLVSPPLLRATAGDHPEGASRASLSQVDDSSGARVIPSSSEILRSSAELHRRSAGADRGPPTPAPPAAAAQLGDLEHVSSERRETAVRHVHNADG
ncbi:MAG: hypothetical protein BJ554DRAFT_2312 [Olpidium bornovanus]|uniref:Uncharacterized protein n=1 Tax=Olpidium bornovanus TaxID=278681 RepID=A0A8H7ZR30_9FUNG|nr:MAG: hypothetical protein BJ554DRAFT_2312 [Olpidium bornovanus]